MRSLVAIAVVLVSSPAAATARTDYPYAGCIFEEASGTPSPLLVVLHGDQQAPAALREVFGAPAAKRSIAVLYLKCPTALGCKGSFWSWNGDPRFIAEAVDAVASDHPVDPDRVWLAGWSGGASYLGMHAFELAPRFAAMSIDGGGVAPLQAKCPIRVPPTYFLVGDKNPLHALAKDLKRTLEGCGAGIVWDVRAGANHAGEWKALRGHAGNVLDWLVAHPRATVMPVALATPSSSVAPASVSSVETAPPRAEPTSPEPRNPGGRVRCACDVAAREPPMRALLVGALLCATRVWRRARAGGGR